MKRFTLPTLKPREQLLASLSGVVLLILLLDWLVLGPWMRRSQLVHDEIVHKTQALKTYQALLSRKETVFARLQPYKDYLRPAPADDLQMAALLEEVEELAHRSGVELAEVKPLAVERNEFTSRYPLDVRFQCTLEEWVDFLTAIETSPSLFLVERAGLVMREETADKLDATLRIASESIRPQESGAKPQARLMDQHADATRVQ